MASAIDQICVVGVGHGGSAAVDRMAADWRGGPRIVIVDTDVRFLESSAVADRIQIGTRVTRGQSTGGDALLGRTSAEDEVERIQSLFAGVNLVFVVVGLGGGTGTGAAPVLARAARESGATTLCFVTLPFDFESEQCKKRAEQGLAELRQAADAVIVVPNQRLFSLVEGAATVADSFARADTVLGRTIYSIWKLIVTPGLFSLGLADLQNVLQNGAGVGAIGYGDGSGPNKARAAVDALLASPLLEGGQLLADAMSVLISIVGGTDLTLPEIETVMNAIKSAVRKDAHIFMGTVVEDGWKGRVSVTALVSEQWAEEPAGAAPQLAPTAGSATGDEAEGSREKEPAKGGRRRGRERQGDLSLDAADKGRFKDVEPTILDGEDLDIPTYLRRGIPI